MADSSTPPPTTEPNSQQSEPENPPPQSNQPDLSSPPSSSTPTTSVPINPNPSPPPPIISPPQPPSVQPYAPPQIPAVPPSAPPSFRPVAPPVPLPAAPLFSPLPNPNLPNSAYQNPSVQPPGVSHVPVMVPGAVSVGGSVGASVPQMIPHYAQPPNPALRHYAPMQNGYQTMPAHAPHGTIPPPGIPRYPSPYTTMIRSPFPPRPPGAIGMLPILSRPPVPGIRPPIIPPVVRPSVAPSVTPAEKPQTTVYVGKIASTVENDFMLSLLQLCGPVKNWKRAQDPTNGTPKGFGFCEFDSAEGVLRALRLLSKLNVDGLELVLNVNQATREFLESYVEKKKENSKKLKTETEGTDKEEENAPGVEKTESPKPSVEDTEKDDNDLRNKETHDVANFGMVTDEDREADREAFEKLTGMLQERLKTRPLPPPPSQTSVDGSGNSNSEQPAKSKDGDSDVDIVKNDAVDDKNDNEMTSERRSTGDHDRPETSSPDRSRRHDRRSRDKERDLKREKERELERYEREREQERATRERQRELKIREDEHRYNVLVKDWESREREKERKRKQEKDREKEREYKRRRDITDQEPESDDEDTKRRKHKSYSSDERRRRLREKEEDLIDRLKEEEEIAEAKRRADEEQKQHRQQEQDALKLSSVHVTNGSDEIMSDGTDVGSKDKAVERTSDGDCGHDDHIGDAVLQNGTSDESIMESISSDTRQSSNAPARKLGFGLVGSGKRTAVPSVFHEEEDEDAQKEKKMKPLVPIDYSTEELQVGQPTVSGEPASNLVAAAEFAKRISNVTPKEERPDMEKERSRRSHDRSGQRDRDRNEESNRTRNETRKVTLDRERDREHGLDRAKTPDNQKLLDAKQLIDMIPKTKEELFSYKINWAIYDENELEKRMKPWITKKITEFLGEEEKTLVDYILSSTAEHVKASDMLERLQIILDEEAEMFVLKMWRMLIFEIKKVETGLALRSNT